MSKPQDDTVRTYVKLSAESALAFNDVVEESGQTQVSCLSRVVDWYCSLPADVRRAVYTGGDAVGLLVSQGIAKMQANGSGGNLPESVADAVPTMRLLLDVIIRDHARLQELIRNDQGERVEKSKKGK